MSAARPEGLSDQAITKIARALEAEDAVSTALTSSLRDFIHQENEDHQDRTEGLADQVRELNKRTFHMNAHSITHEEQIARLLASVASLKEEAGRRAQITAALETRLERIERSKPTATHSPELPAVGQSEHKK